jgi:hypothetical protein
MATMASSLPAGATQFESLVGVSYSGLSGQGIGLEHPTGFEHPAKRRQLATTTVRVHTGRTDVDI